MAVLHAGVMFGTDRRFDCPRCGWVTCVRRDQFPVGCLGCSERDLVDLPVGGRRLLRSPELERVRRASRVRLRWDRGWFTEFPVPLDSETRAAGVSPDERRVSLHAETGFYHRFADAGVEDVDGYRLFCEEPGGVECLDWQPVQPLVPRLGPAETFSYRFAIAGEPAGPFDGSPVEDSGGRVAAERDPGLLGFVPALRFEPAGLLRGGGRVSPQVGCIRPAVLGTCMVMTARASGAPASNARLHVDAALVASLKPGDNVHIARTPRGGLGLAVVRDGELTIGVGAVSGVSLGRTLQLTVRRDRVRRAIRGHCPVCRPGLPRPPPGPWEHPLEFTTRERVPRKPTGYAMDVFSGAWPPPEDGDECVAITRCGSCPETSVKASAMLLAATDALVIDTRPVVSGR